MAENEIVKHVEAAYQALKKPNTNWLHKLKEVLIEIAIIVFAVTLSIWFHNWSDSLHERREEREFLTGMRKDIQADLEEARGDSAWYVGQFAGLKYLQRVGGGEPLSQDSLAAYQGVFFSNATFDAHISRYEGMKSSGKLGLITNTDLLNNIIDLHEVAIKNVQNLDVMYADYANRLGNFVFEHANLSPDSKISNAQDVLRSSQMRFLTIYGTSLISFNVLKAHDTCIARCQRLISQLDQELDH